MTFSEYNLQICNEMTLLFLKYRHVIFCHDDYCNVVIAHIVFYRLQSKKEVNLRNMEKLISQRISQSPLCWKDFGIFL